MSSAFVYVQRIIDMAGFIVARKATFEQSKKNAFRDLEIILRYSPLNLVEEVIHSLQESKAQFRQDVFALAESKFKRKGYFVEFGAADGVTGSNTYLLESEYGWSGVVAEPATRFHHDLVQNRNCVRDFRAVYSRSGEFLPFKEAKIGALSTFQFLESKDLYRRYRKQGRVYEVETVSLLDLLDEAGAPSEIDFMSLDTEGSELSILQSFDFNRYRFNAITVEHNFGHNRVALRECLEKAGYRQIHEDISGVDDWYVPDSSR